MAHDLKAIVRRVDREWFGGTLSPRVRWGKMPKIARRHRIHKCAYYSPEDYCVVLHPMFRNPRVPEAVIETLVLHEMLHIVWGPSHSKRFRAAEKSHPDYWRADKWLGYHLNGLSLELGRRVRR